MTTIEWLAQEVARRQAPWIEVDSKGKEIHREPLCTAIVIMPNAAIELLALAELGAAQVKVEP